MEFKNMAKEMTEVDILTLLRIIFPYATLKGYKRHIEHNFITVYYVLPNDTGSQIHVADFLPDDVYTLGETEDEALDGVLKSGESLYRYEQYMIASGYSEYWLSNPYVTSRDI